MTSQGTLITIHGFLGSPADFASGITNTQRYDVDIFGRHSLLMAESKEDWLSRTTSLLRQLAAPRMLIGYSMGGRIALELFARAPEHYERLILISAHPGLSSAEEKQARQQSDEGWAQKILTLPTETVLKEWNEQEALKSSEPLKTLPLCSRSLLAQTLRTFSLAEQQDLRPVLSKHQKRISYVAGAEDKKFTEIGNSLKEEMPGIEVKIIGGVGHRLTKKHFEVFATLVDNESRTAARLPR